MNLGRMLMSTYPFVSGIGTLVNNPLLRRLFPSEASSGWAQVDGGKILVPFDDYVGRAVRYAGDLDRKISWVIDRAVEPGDVAFDIGANYGLVTLRMAARVGAQGRVHAFEPNPKVLVFLRQTLERNPSARIKLHELALGAEPGELPLFSPEGNDGASSLAHSSRAGGRPGAMVPVATLDSLSRAEALNRCDFIKMDIEGFEHEALKGGQAFLRRTRPRAILLEESARPGPSGLPPSLELLQGLGYDLYALPRKLLSVQLVPIDRMGAARVHDYVAVLADCSPETKRRLGIA